MQILNPLYDSTFKYLMEDNNIAKIVLSIILDADIVSLQAKPQETSVLNSGLFRFDYKAVVNYKNGKHKTILIEVQKYNSPNPIKRFRKYLGINYALSETIHTKDGEKEASLPLVAVYIIGFDLPEFNCRIIKVDNQLYDVVGDKVLNVESSFVEKLNHTSYILIAKKKMTKSDDTLIEQLLDLFIQKLQGEKSNPIIDISEESFNSKLRPVIERLQRATLNNELLRKVELEQDYIDRDVSRKQQLKEALVREEEERRQKEEERRQKEAAEKREEEERRAKKSLQHNFAVKMLKDNAAISEIVQLTGLTEEEIKKLM